MCISKRQLESELQQLAQFETPRSSLEQYCTPASVAASLLCDLQLRHGCLAGRCVLDLGCGPGCLLIGSLLLGAAYACGVDVDPDALRVCAENRRRLLPQAEIGASDLLLCDVRRLPDAGAFPGKFHTVITNPPFGTFAPPRPAAKARARDRRRPAADAGEATKGIDVLFLELGVRLATDLVVSLHKDCTVPHVLQRARAACRRRLGEAAVEGRDFVVRQSARLRFNLDRSYRHHRSDSVDIDVGVVEVQFLRAPGDSG